MWKSMMILALLAWPASAFSHGGPEAGPALVAHSAAHKVERLIALRKIDPHFQDRLASIQVLALTRSSHDDPAFKAVVSQVPDNTGKAQQVEILLDDAGKALSFSVVAGPESTDAPVWPGVDSLALAENGVHYLLDNAEKPELKPFLSGFVSVALTQVKDDSGRPEARMELKSKDTESVLEVILHADGTFASAKVIDHAEAQENRLADHQGGGDWIALGCVRSYRQCEIMGHRSGFYYHSITHDHRYCSSARARFTCWGSN